MARKVEENKRHYYNEHDENQVNRLYYQRRKKKRKLRMKRIAFILGIVIIVAFFVSPYSRVQKITISGHVLVSEDDILKQANISEESVHALTFSNSIKKRLEGYACIEEVRVVRGLLNTIHIEVKEAMPFAYQELEKNIALVTSDGELYYVKKDKLPELNLSVRLINFTDASYLEKFAKDYVNIPEAIRSLVSDITYAPEEPYDRDRIRFDMNDGKIVYVRLEDMSSGMKYYQEILSTKPNACVYDIHGKNAYASDCE